MASAAKRRRKRKMAQAKKQRALAPADTNLQPSSSTTETSSSTVVPASKETTSNHQDAPSNNVSMTTVDLADDPLAKEPKSEIEAPLVQEASDVDVLPISQAIYGTAKNVWSFGTHIPLLNIWMGFSHGMLKHAVGFTTGQELNTIDHGIETKLAEMDYHVSRFLGRGHGHQHQESS